MITTLFSRCLNLIWHYVHSAKSGVHIAHSRLGVWFYFIANQSVRMISTVYPPPPPLGRSDKMTSRSAHLLALVALGMLMASGPAFAQTDYDTDNDNLIDITSLAQLNAIRYDLNGDGTVATTDTMNYNAAFPNAMSGMGCAATCNGYELMNNLNLASYSEWTPIGSPFATTFDGNGYTLTGLKITNGSTYTGLFGQVGPAGVIRDLGIINGSVRSGINLSGVGMLTGENNGGTITGCYAEGGTVYFGATGTNIGGLAGGTQGTISASYSTATMRQEGGRSVTLGGLVGFLGQQGALHGMIIDSYAAAPWSSTQGNANPTTGGGLLGTAQGANVRVTGSYCDTSVAAWSQCISTSTANTTAASKTTADLQNPLGYTGIYANWNIDVNGDRVPDNPWNFGTTSQYPTLKTPTQRAVVIDYDSDNDGLIDVTSLSQLNAIRYDLNGDGLPTGTNADTIAYAGAFPGGDITASSGRMGCAATCTGYELMNNLDFDENNDDQITSADATYWNSGAGWTPIGVASTGAATLFTATFDGNDYTISNLFINSNTSTATGGGFVGLFGDVTGTIRDVGLLDVNITNTRTSTASSNNFGRTGALAGRLSSGGTVRGSYVAGGSVTHTTSSTSAGSLGCLLGYAFAPVSDSYATCNVAGTNNLTLSAGGLIGETTSTVDSTYATGTVTNTGSGSVAIGGLIGWSYGRVSVSYATGNVTAAGRGRAGGLIGNMAGPSYANYATGNVSGTGTGDGSTNALSLRLGGLIGRAELGSGEYLYASYATGNVSGSGTGVKAGGLIGRVSVSISNSITAVYAIGAVSNTATGTTATGGLAGERGGSITAAINYGRWDTQTTGQSTTAGTLINNLGARTTSALQSPTGYTGSYVNWNQNLDGQTGNDDPWYFGATNQYPVLKYAGLDTTAQFTLQPPGRPVVAVTSNGDTLYVGWSAASQATGYTVQWKSGMQSYDASRQATTTATRYKIPLTTGTTYTVRVLATKTGARNTASVEVMRAPGLTNYDTDGDGLIAITTLAQLNAIRHDLNGNGDATHADYDAAFPGRDTSNSARMGCLSGCTGYELLNDLDFDENNDGAITSADATYWNSGNGWEPIGTDADTDAPYTSQYHAGFKGNGYTINNLYISRPSTNDVGLFGAISSPGRIETLGVINADVTARYWVGILAGTIRGDGDIVACYTTGEVAGNQNVGGLVGYMLETGPGIHSSYSTASASGSLNVGGLLARQDQGGSITNSYSTGRISGTGNSPVQIGGLLGLGLTGSVVSNSYWDTSTSGTTSSGGGTGKTTRELLSPTTYGATSSDPYYNWNANIDGQAGNDDPWTFGAMDQYPVLKYAGMDTTVQFQLQPAVVTLALTPSSISESGGMSTVTATLTRSWSTATTITVRPVAGAYTVGTDSTITIAAGSTANASDTVVITAVDNTRDAPDRDVDMSVVADNAQGSVVLPTEITIIDDDAPPRLSISSPSAVEGTALTFTVRLNAVSDKEVTVAYADAGTGTATSGTDYTALTAGTLTFAAGVTSQTIAVSVSDDGDDEPNETVIVTLSSATNATISTAQGTGTIIDDDGMPALSIGSPSVIEGATGATLTFRVYLSPMHTAQVTVAYADAGTGTATSGTDYTALTAGTLTFAVGDTIQTIPVSVTDDSDDEQNETVIVTLSSATNATISTAQGTGTIIDDESPSANLDIDGNGRVDLFTDIIMVIRYALSFREESLTYRALSVGATRTTHLDITAYIDRLYAQKILDVDRNGEVDLFTDIIMVIRYALSFREESLTYRALSVNATRTTHQDITAYIRSLHPDSHFQ